MRLALRSGLVEPGAARRGPRGDPDAFKRVAELAAIPPPLLDDLLWELGRDDPDLLGAPPATCTSPRATRGRAWY